MSIVPATMIVYHYSRRPSFAINQRTQACFVTRLLEYGNRTGHEAANQFWNAGDTTAHECVNPLLHVRNWNAFSGRNLDLYHCRQGHGGANSADHQALGALDLRDRRNYRLRNVAGQNVVNLPNMADGVLARCSLEAHWPARP